MNSIKKWFNKRYGWVIKAYTSEVKVSSEGDVYLEPKSIKERYLKICDASGITELSNKLWK